MKNAIIITVSMSACDNVRKTFENNMDIIGESNVTFFYREGKTIFIIDNGSVNDTKVFSEQLYAFLYTVEKENQ